MFSIRIDGAGSCNFGPDRAKARPTPGFYCLAIGLVLGLNLPTSTLALSTIPVAGQHNCSTQDRFSPDAAPNRPFEVVARYPHDQDAFTQGLAFHQGKLYESTGIRRQSSLRRLDLESGRVLKQQRLSNNLFGEGLAVLDDQLIQLTWQSGAAFIYSPAELQQTSSFSIGGVGWGATVLGNQLVISDGSSWLRFLDTTHYQKGSTLQVKEGGRSIKGLNELEVVDDLIYANIYPGDCIAQIDPQSGEVVGWIDLAGLIPLSERSNHSAVANGIAYNPETGELFVTGKLWPYIYQLKLLDTEILPDKQTALPDTTG